jgi:hypothetical protein
MGGFHWSWKNIHTKDNGEACAFAKRRQAWLGYDVNWKRGDNERIIKFWGLGGKRWVGCAARNEQRAGIQSGVFF